MPTGATIYVLNQGSNDITVLNGNTEGLITASVLTGGTSPSMIVADHVLNRLYVSNTGPLSVLNITAASQSGPSTTYTYTLVSGPALTVGESVAVAGMANSGNNGSFTIATLGAGTFTVVNAGGVTSTSQTGTGKASPGTVSVFDSTMNPISPLVIPGHTNPFSIGVAPIALAVTPDGSKVYVGNTGSNSASSINTTTFSTTSLTVPGDNVTWVAVSKDGTRAYISMTGAGDLAAKNGTAIVITASNSLLTNPNNSNKPVLIAPTPQDLTTACAEFGPPNDCNLVLVQHPVQIVPRL